MVFKTIKNLYIILFFFSTTDFLNLNITILQSLNVMHSLYDVQQTIYVFLKEIIPSR